MFCMTVSDAQYVREIALFSCTPAMLIAQEHGVFKRALWTHDAPQVSMGKQQIDAWVFLFFVFFHLTIF